MDDKTPKPENNPAPIPPAETPPNPVSSPIVVSSVSPNLSPNPSPTATSGGNISGKPLKSKKSKMILIGAVVIVVILIAGGALYALHSKKAVSVACTTESCFDPHFSNCTLATLAANSAFADVKYQIYGKNGNRCSMLFEYTSNPNPAWANKEMTCDFNNSLSLDNSVEAVFNNLTSKQNAYNCTGPLVAVLQSQGQ